MLELLANEEDNVDKQLKDASVYTSIFVELSEDFADGIIQIQYAESNLEMVSKMTNCLEGLIKNIQKFEGYSQIFSVFEEYLIHIFKSNTLKKIGKASKNDNLDEYIDGLKKNAHYFDSKGVVENIQLFEVKNLRIKYFIDCFPVENNENLKKKSFAEYQKTLQNVEYFQALTNSWDIKIQNFLVVFFFSGALDNVEGESIKKLMVKYFFFLSLFLKSEKFFSSETIRMFFVIFIFWVKCIQKFLFLQKINIEEEDKAIIEKFMLNFFFFLKSKPQAEMVVNLKINVKENKKGNY